MNNKQQQQFSGNCVHVCMWSEKVIKINHKLYLRFVFFFQYFKQKKKKVSRNHINLKLKCYSPKSKQKYNCNEKSKPHQLLAARNITPIYINNKSYDNAISTAIKHKTGQPFKQGMHENALIWKPKYVSITWLTDCGCGCDCNCGSDDVLVGVTFRFLSLLNCYHNCCVYWSFYCFLLYIGFYLP